MASVGAAPADIDREEPQVPAELTKPLAAPFVFVQNTWDTIIPVLDKPVMRRTKRRTQDEDP